MMIICCPLNSHKYITLDKLDSRYYMDKEACVNLVNLGTNNAPFCGVNKTWQPRDWMTETDHIHLKIVILPTVFVAVIYSVAIVYMTRSVWKTYQSFLFHIDNFPADTDILGCVQKCLACVTDQRRALEISFVVYWWVLPVAYMLYDCLDVFLDLSYFYKLELLTGNLLDNWIMRNQAVNNAILVFSISGCLKAFLVLQCNYAISNQSNVLIQLTDSPSSNRRILEECMQAVAMVNRSKITLIALIFEDGVELFLEYFYADKYATKSDWLVLLNATLMAAIAGLAMVMNFRVFLTKLWLTNIKRDRGVEDCHSKYLFLTLPVQLIAVSKVLRAYACWVQASSGEIGIECLEVKEGALIQTPFIWGCLSKIDILILLFTVLSFGAIFCQFLSRCSKVVCC